MRHHQLGSIVILAGLLIAGLSSASGSEQDKNKKIARRAWEEVINKGNMSAVAELYDASYVYHTDPTVAGPDGVKTMVTTYRTAFPDLHLTLEDVLAEGDKVVVRFTAKGTHRGDLMGIAPSGKVVTVKGISIVRIAGGKIVEEWEHFDDLGMMKQIGAIPMEDVAPE
jgi:steroid delta-isomerase-like uncharacterized protein